jgi:hypothetical protein
MKKIPQQRKRFYYSAGMISLLVLPILMGLYLQNNKLFKKQHALEIVWWKNHWGEFEIKPDFDKRPDRNYLEFHLTTDDKENKIKLDYSQLEVRKLIAKNDTLNGVHFAFDDDANYWTFIRALDICKRENAKTYIIVDNDIWLFNCAPKPVVKETVLPLMHCGTGPMNCCPIYNELATDDDNEISIVDSIKPYWLSIALFIMLLFLGVKKNVEIIRSQRRK